MPVYTHTQFEHYLSIVIAANGIVQLLLDIVMEALHVVPTRINHLSLTVLNAFLAWKTLSAIQKDKFRFLHEDCQVLFLLEFALIAGDIYYMIKDDFEPTFIYARLFFLICSTFNFLAVVWIMHKYGLWSLSYQGDITEADDGDQEQAIAFFYRPSTARQSEIAMERTRSSSRSTSTVSNPVAKSRMESVIEEDNSRESSNNL